MPKKRYKHKIFHVKRTFKKEFKRQLRFAIIAAIGFIIAFSWRDAIYNSANSIVEKFTDVAGVVLSEIYTAVFITLVGVAVLLISSKFLKEKR